MGDILSSLQGLGSEALQGAQTLGGDVLSGINDIGSSLGGLFGGGGAVSPGTLGAAGAQTANAAAPSALAAGVDASAVAPAAGQAAASIMSGPGVSALDTSGIGQGIMNPVGMVDQTAGGLLPSASPTLTNAVGASGGPTVTGINQGILSDVGQGVSTVPGLPQGGNFLTSLLKNPKLLAEGGLLGAELLNANKTPTGEAQLKQLAAQQAGFAKNQGELATAEGQGLLPAGATNLFQGQLNAAEAAIRAKYAQMGMTGSSAEMQDLAAARDQVMGQIFQTGQQMAQTGWANVNQATGYQSQLLDEILATETQQGTALGQALAAFAGAAAK